MTSAAEDQPRRAQPHGAAASRHAADAAAETPGVIANLPALIGSAPLPPAPVERLAATPEDALERFAFALWAAGRKDEAVEFLERQIARYRPDAPGMPATPASPAREAPPELLDVVPSPFASIPPPPVPKRPFILTAVLAAAIAVVWIGPENIALPDWLSSSRLALWSGESPPADAAAPAVAETAPSTPAAAESAGPGPVIIPASETASQAAPVIEEPREVETALAEPATTGSTGSVAEHEDEAAPAAPTARTAESPSEEPPAPTLAAAGISDMARRAGGGAALASTLPEADDDAPVTLQALGGSVPGDPRLPRPRPDPSPATVAAVLAPATPPHAADPEPRAAPFPRIVEEALVVADAEPAAAQPQRLTIIGRVGRPGLVLRRAEAERYAAARRALAERRAVRRYEAPWGAPPDAPWGYPAMPYPASPYPPRRLPWVYAPNARWDSEIEEAWDYDDEDDWRY